MPTPNTPADTSQIPVKDIPGKKYQGRVTKKKCINGVVHILTIDVYCCPFEEIVVNDQPTNEKCP